MDLVIFAGSLHFALLGVGLAILMLWAGNIGALMALPLLLAAGLTPEQAIPIALFISAALIVPGVVDQLRSRSVDKTLAAVAFLGVLPGAFVSQYLTKFSNLSNLSHIALLALYLLLLIGSFIYRRKPFALLPRPNNPVRKRIVSLLNKLPGKIKLIDSGIHICPVIPLFLGFIVSLTAGILGPVAAMLLCPVMVIFLEVPIFIAFGTVALINILSFVTVAATSGMLAYPIPLQILLWMFLGTSLTYTLFSGIFRKRKLHPLPLAIVFVMITSLNLL